MMSKTKRSSDESGGQGSKRQRLGFYETLRFKPLKDDAAKFSEYIVEYYTQMWGQNLFMEKGDGYIDVRFVDTEAALNVILNIPMMESPAPFTMQPARSIDLDAIQVISPGEVKMYQPPRDLDHYDGTPCVPHGWNNPFPIKFQPPPRDPRKVVDPRRPPRFKPIYPALAQPPPASPSPPFNQPEWLPIPPWF